MYIKGHHQSIEKATYKMGKKIIAGYTSDRVTVSRLYKESK